MSSEEAVHASLTEVTPRSGKATLGTWWSLRQARARLDKTGHSTAIRARDEAISKPIADGVYANQRLNFATIWEGLFGEIPGLQTGLEKIDRPEL